jgi:hypothetical protein
MVVPKYICVQQGKKTVVCRLQTGHDDPRHPLYGLYAVLESEQDAMKLAKNLNENGR